MAAGQLMTLDSLFDGYTQEITPSSVLETIRGSHRSHCIVCLCSYISCERVYPLLYFIPADQDGDNVAP